MPEVSNLLQHQHKTQKAHENILLYADLFNIPMIRYVCGTFPEEAYNKINKTLRAQKYNSKFFCNVKRTPQVSFPVMLYPLSVSTSIN